MLETDIFLRALVGIASGTMLGLAGAGGGIIAIPILMTFGGYNVKDASGYALLALTVGTTISWFMQQKDTVYPVAIVLIVFSATTAFVAAPLKAMSPHWFIISFLNLACAFSLYNMWVLRRYRKLDHSEENRPLTYQLKTASIGGIMTGFLNTMTGLAGSVVLIPWLAGITRLGFEQARACSFLTIAITCPISAWRQDTSNLGLQEWIALCLGIILAAFIIKKGLQYIAPHRTVILRELALTGVILLAMVRTLSELFE